MKIVRYVCRVWRWWCELWRIDWDELARIDSHKWESKTEYHWRLSGPHHDHGRVARSAESAKRLS
jgi:hypothetical protein